MTSLFKKGDRVQCPIPYEGVKRGTVDELLTFSGEDYYSLLLDDGTIDYVRASDCAALYEQRRPVPTSWKGE